MRVLAIGATGFIGRHVVSRLVSQGHEVALLHRGKTVAPLPGGVRHLLGDRNRLADSQSELERLAPEVVLDMILYTEQQAGELVEALRGRAGRVVAVSSADVYRNYDGLRGKAASQPDPVPLAEESPLRETRYPYRGQKLPFEYAHDYEKILVEQVLLNDAQLPATVLRLPAVYGPGDRQRRLRPYLERMTNDEEVILIEEGQGGWRWTRGFVANVAAAVALAVTDDRSARRVYNVGDEPTLTEREWIEQIGVAVGWKGEIVTVSADELPDHLELPFDWRYDLWIDTARIRDELGFVEPVALDEGLKRTVEREREGGDGIG